MLVNEPETVYTISNSILQGGQYVNNYKGDVRAIMFFTNKEIIVTLLNGTPLAFIKQPQYNLSYYISRNDSFFGYRNKKIVVYKDDKIIIVEPSLNYSKIKFLAANEEFIFALCNSETNNNVELLTISPERISVSTKN
ncbi:MAG: hypothetical protein MHPSP_001307 [Paramarteilia canceri]